MKSSRNPIRKLPVFSVTQEILINLFKAAQQSLDVIPDGSDSSTSLRHRSSGIMLRKEGWRRKERGRETEKVRKSWLEGRADRVDRLSWLEGEWKIQPDVAEDTGKFRVN